MIKAIFLDFDGLIVDTESAIYEVFKKWFRTNNNIELVIDEFLLCVGADDDVLFDTLDKKHNIKIDREKFSNEVYDEVAFVCQDLEPRDGIIKLIKETKSLGIKLAVVTPSYRSKIISHLNRLNIIQYFDGLITREDVELAKPNPEPYLRGLEVLDVSKDEALIFEDSVNGIISGVNAGIKVIAYPNEITKYGDLSKAYFIVNDMVDFSILDYISKLN